MVERMRISSVASRYKMRASSVKSPSEATIIRKKNRVSFASLMQRLALFRKSFFETQSFASQKFAPMLVPAPTIWLIKRSLTGLRRICFANRTMFSPKTAVRSSKSNGCRSFPLFTGSSFNTHAAFGSPFPSCERGYLVFETLLVFDVWFLVFFNSVPRNRFMQVQENARDLR